MFLDPSVFDQKPVSEPKPESKPKFVEEMQASTDKLPTKKNLSSGGSGSSSMLFMAGAGACYGF